MAASVIIIGAGQAGFQVAASLREKGFDGTVTLIGAERHGPYQRPPLSKAYLAQPVLPVVDIRPATFYRDKAIDLLIGKRAVAIERDRREVRLDSGETLRYDHLVFATGGRNRRLGMAGEDLEGVLSLRDLDDAEHLRGRMREAKQMVIVGGGYIGLEVGSYALALGIPTTIIEAASRLCARVASKDLSEFFERHYREAGTDIRFDTTLAAIDGRDGRVDSVRLSTGETLPASLLLVCVGILPNVELAEACGLKTANGITVDRFLRTSDPHIYAIGDSARFPSRHAAGESVRVESVANASDQGRTVAEAILGHAKPFENLPWFWSEQGKLKLQIAGWTQGHDRTVVKGDTATGLFSVFCFRGQTLAGVECMNRPTDFVAARRAMTEGIVLGPDEVASPAFDFKSRLGPLRAPV